MDDNQDVADSEAELLRIVGFNPRACYDGRSALRVAREFAPDVCLIDLHMPDMDGDELAGRLRAEAAGRPVLMVAVTAMSNDESHARTQAAGFALHLVKPVDPHDLLRVVDELWRVLDPTGATRAAGPSS
ncbi:MAG: response regulator [Gemmataceae bacterium]|nr:response regulator [Gemmataceae bacterium]